MIPDSPRWYLRKGLIEQAKEIILDGASTNKIEVPDDLDNLLALQAAAM